VTSQGTAPECSETGLSMAYDEGISKKWVQLLKEAAPSVSRVGLLRDASAPFNPKMHTDTEAAAATCVVNPHGVRLDRAKRPAPPILSGE